MATNLYVGNLAFSVTGRDLEELFSQAGQAKKATVITDKFSGQSRGFGFVEMATAEGAAQAIRQFDGADLQGRNLKVNEARPRESSFGGRDRRGSRSGPGRSGNRW